MSNPNLELVKLKRGLQKFKSEQDLINDALAILGKIPDVSTLLKDPELVLYVCNLVENNSYDGVKKLDKKALVIKICVAVNPAINNEQDINVLKTLIDFLHSTKKIKKLNIIKKYGGAVLNWAVKKFL
jgi:hypothetical protein